MFTAYFSKRRKIFIFFFLVATLTFVKVGSAKLKDFTFVHITDSHSESAVTISQNTITFAQLSTLDIVYLAPYKTFSFKPSFIIHTGDITEYGGEHAWSIHTAYLVGIKIPIYHVCGNHDNTWSALNFKIRENYGAPFYSFDTFGCHFVGLCSASPQEPLPSIGIEQINWLKQDLAKVGPKTPIFIFFHHPLHSTEFANPIEKYALLDILRPYNVVLILNGHGHQARYYNEDGIDAIMGGSTYDLRSPAGFNLITVSKGTIRVAYKPITDTVAQLGLLEKPIPLASTYPKIEIIEPKENAVITSSVLTISSRSDLKNVKTVHYQLDNDETLYLMKAAPKEGKEIYTATTTLSNDFKNGGHYIRIVYTTEDGSKYYKIRKFYVERDPKEKPTSLWRYFLPGSSRSAPLVYDDVVYVGANDGALYGISAKTGTLLWKYSTDGEIVSSPAIYVNKQSGLKLVYFGSADKYIYAVDAKTGKLKWRYQAQAPVYCSPIVYDTSVYIADNSGKLYCLDAETGTQNWVNSSAEYSIESKVSVSPDGKTLYLGPWDSYVYAIDAKTGTLLWKTQPASPQIRPSAKRYYSAADCPAAVSEKTNFVYFTDRDYRLSAIDSRTGTLSWFTTDCVSAIVSEDGESLYIRKLSGTLAKTTLAGDQLWSTFCELGRIPVPPTEKNGIVYVCSNRGLLSAIDGKTGSILWQYQVTPGGYYVMSGVAVDSSGVVYVSAMDGSLSAISSPAGLKEKEK